MQQGIRIFVSILEVDFDVFPVRDERILLLIAAGRYELKLHRSVEILFRHMQRPNLLF